jgi:hypothetical protein
MKILAANHPNDPIDVMIGDWMSEGNMTVRAGGKVDGMPITYYIVGYIQNSQIPLRSRRIL